MVLRSLPLLVLLLQLGEGWALVPDLREVKRLYHDLFQTTEVWVRLVPKNPDGKPGPVNVIFQAFFPGRAQRNPYSGLPEWPKGPPARLVLKVLHHPLSIIYDHSLSFVIDGTEIDPTEGSCSRLFGHCTLLYPCDDCSANGMAVELKPAFVRTLASAASVNGTALGSRVVFSAADRAALARFVEQIGIGEPAGASR